MRCWDCAIQLHIFWSGVDRAAELSWLTNSDPTFTAYQDPFPVWRCLDCFKARWEHGLRMPIPRGCMRQAQKMHHPYPGCGVAPRRGGPGGLPVYDAHGREIRRRSRSPRDDNIGPKGPRGKGFD